MKKELEAGRRAAGGLQTVRWEMIQTPVGSGKGGRKRWQTRVRLKTEGEGSSLWQHGNIKGRRVAEVWFPSMTLVARGGIVIRNGSGSKMALVPSEVTLHTNQGWL